jgi:signal transduction histidine kinase
MRTAMTRTNGPGRVLLVDDHPAVRRVLRSLLEEVGGVGLGLFLVDQLVSGMAGKVWVEDAPGGGARFVAELPDPGP